MKEILVA